MTAIASGLDEMRLAIGEVDAVAAVTLTWFDDEDWSGADPALVERAGFMLGVLARSAAFAAAKIESLHVAVADAQALPSNSRWEGEGTASSTG